LTIPATIGLWLLAGPLVALVFEHGDFTPLDTLGTVSALRCHLVGLIFAAVDQPLIFAFYARRNTWTPALVGVATVLLYVAMALLPTLFRPLSLNGLILANSAKSAMHAVMMLLLLRRSVGKMEHHGAWVLILKASFASALMAGTVYVVLPILQRIVPAGLLGEVVLVAAAGAVGTLVYVAVALLLRIREIGLLRQAFVEWIRRLPLRNGRL